MSIKRWDGTAWVTVNETIGDTDAPNPLIKVFRDGTSGLGWYPCESVKRWTGTAWVDVYRPT